MMITPGINPKYPTRFDSYLTVRLPATQTADEAYKIIQSEIIRPLSSLLKDRYTTCKLAGIGVYSQNPYRHIHALLLATVPLPIIDWKQDPTQARHWRNRITERHGLTVPKIQPGIRAVELTPILDQTAAHEYVEGHLYDPNASELIFGKEILRKLLNRTQAA
jgi:hypothetical protein